jgi:hypothetical protein
MDMAERKGELLRLLLCSAEALRDFATSSGRLCPKTWGSKSMASLDAMVFCTQDGDCPEDLFFAAMVDS